MKVLLIGNSHTYYNDMPHLLELFAEERGLPMETVMLAHPGQSFQWHMNEYNEVRYNLLYGKYDYCILQQVAHPMPTDLESTFSSAVRLCSLCRAGGAKPVFSLTWAEKEFPEHQALMDKTYREMAAQNSALLSPVGFIWQEVRSRHPEIELYWQDNRHASPYGSYLIACCHFRLLTSQPVTGLSPKGLDFYHGLTSFETSVEDPSQTAVLLDAAACTSIQTAVDTYFETHI